MLVETVLHSSADSGNGAWAAARRLDSMQSAFALAISLSCVHTRSCERLAPFGLGCPGHLRTGRACGL